MRTHWRIKPYSCPECHRNFVRQDALTRHLRLDFGHNRCSGYPGPLPGNADQGEKDAEDEENMEDDEDFPDPDAADQNAGEEKTTSTSTTKNATGAATATVKPDPSPALPSPTTPTTVAKAKANATSPNGAVEQERERPFVISTTSTTTPTTAAPANSSKAAMDTHPTPRTSDSTQLNFEKDDQERSGRPNTSSPHARHSTAGAAPMSFVHMADRPSGAPSDGSKEGSAQPHGRSYSHSTFNYGPTSPLTIQTGNMPLRPSKQLERRATAPVIREGDSWSGHGQGQGYGQDTVTSPVDEYSRQGPSYGGYRHDMDRPRSATHLPPDYPTSPKEIRRSPGPQSAQGEWHSRSGPPSGHWGWNNGHPPPSQDSRLRHPTWSSSALPPHPQDPALMPPPHSPVESWSRGHPPSPHDDPRKGMSRSLSRYGSSPYPLPEHGAAERHHRGASGPMSPVGPMRSSDPYRRSTSELDPRQQRSVAEMDRVGSWSEQRSRFHGSEGMQDPRSRYETGSGSLPSVSSAMSAGRPPVTGEALPLSMGSERNHGVSGMIGVERMYPSTSGGGGGSFHERDFPSGPATLPPHVKTSMGPGDPNGRDYRPTRSHSMMDYDSERMSAMARRSRYGDDPKVMLREERRSMSPGPSSSSGHRLPSIDTSRSYEGSGPRYPYSAGAERPPGHGPDRGSGGNGYPREEMDEMQARSLRRDDGGVPSSAGGYYDEHPRSATFQRTPHGY
ncbi:hypothetical protein BGX33_008301 [Mortierella sp. NVP41]|nr:hypothetical protein BGX33_008301 [Mortierella sp. NVP41]